MKQKIVLYRDLFNPENIIKAENKLSTPTPRPSIKSMLKKITEPKPHKCKCRHQKMINGICVYRNCFHTIKEHN